MAFHLEGILLIQDAVLATSDGVLGFEKPKNVSKCVQAFDVTGSHISRVLLFKYQFTKRSLWKQVTQWGTNVECTSGQLATSFGETGSILTSTLDIRFVRKVFDAAKRVFLEDCSSIYSGINKLSKTSFGSFDCAWFYRYISLIYKDSKERYMECDVQFTNQNSYGILLVRQREGKGRSHTCVRQIKKGSIVLPSRAWRTIVA